MNNVESIKKYNIGRIDITKLINSKEFSLSNYLSDEKVVELIKVGVPCGAIQATYKGKDLSHREEHLLSDEELSKVKVEYVPINTFYDFIVGRMTYDSSFYTINPNYIEPKKVPTFMYRFNLLTNKEMGMFEIADIKKHKKKMQKNIPLTYEKLEKMRNKYITPEKEELYIEKNRANGINEKGFYAWLNGEELNDNKQKQNEKETEDEFE